MTAILAISGSLRRDSLNTRLLRAAAQLVPARVTLELAELHGVPLYDGDVEEAQGIPPAVQALKARATDADALLIATPEYNNAAAGVLKNAIDWMSRPPADIAKVFRGKPVAIVGATPGRMGTVLAQASLLPTVRTLGMRLYTGATLYVPGAMKAFAEDGALSDQELRERLRVYLKGFVGFVDS